MAIKFYRYLPWKIDLIENFQKVSRIQFFWFIYIPFMWLAEVYI